MTTLSVPPVARRRRRALAGDLHVPGDPGYDVARRPLHDAIDPRPAMVVEARGAADVRAAVVAAREHELPVAVQATGHGTHVPADGAILVRTSDMAAVLVDPDRRIARVGPGAVWGDVLAAAAPFGLAPLSGSSPSVGVTGYTLGGGLGWLARRHGFAADSLLRAEVVTADGSIVTATADDHADLFWALRGGGGSFGVVTAMELRLHPVGQVYAGTACFAIDRAPETLVRYREWIADAPDALSTAVLLMHLPDGRRVLAIRAVHVGGPDEARRLLAPLFAALVDGMRPMRLRGRADGRHRAQAPRAARGAAGRRHRRAGGRRRRADDRGPSLGRRDVAPRGGRRPGGRPRRDPVGDPRRPRARRGGGDRASCDWPLVPELPRRSGPHGDGVRARRSRGAARGQGGLRPGWRVPPRPRHPAGRRDVQP